ncbi:DUF4176 domain-containing protein [Enterococcus mundtii]|uniref:DUF4176 domain-containing protein n=1 Tax=Enterococcus TaxID=1350 RepID=UPI00129D13AC|nr:DUF4176 domain-containing protein [Enterococcus mundtii]MRI74979.1 DUF4176 domain-containing protein [Enterococcus mundtii]
MKNLFKASFEESLNLKNDKLINYMKNDVERWDLKERPILLKILALALIGMLYGIVLFTNSIITNHDKNSLVPQADINFLPLSLFWILLVMYLVIWVYTLIKRYRATKFFWGYINAVNIFVWLVIETNLLFITAFLKPLTAIGMGIFFSIILLVGYIVVRSKKASLENLLYDTNKKEKVDEWIEKSINLVVKYSSIVVIIGVIWNFIFPSGDTPRTDVTGFLGFLAMWFVFDIGFIIAQAYLFLPYLLRGYYRHKYSEEYRNLEGKTQLEWYGEKYFNKHIKGTDKEEIYNE